MNFRLQTNTTIIRVYIVVTGLRTRTMKSLMSTSLMKGLMMLITESTCMTTSGTMMMMMIESPSVVTRSGLQTGDSFSSD